MKGEERGGGRNKERRNERDRGIGGNRETDKQIEDREMEMETQR